MNFKSTGWRQEEIRSHASSRRTRTSTACKAELSGTNARGISWVPSKDVQGVQLYYIYICTKRRKLVIMVMHFQRCCCSSFTEMYLCPLDIDIFVNKVQSQDLDWRLSPEFKATSLGLDVNMNKLPKSFGSPFLRTNFTVEDDSGTSLSLQALQALWLTSAKIQNTSAKISGVFQSSLHILLTQGSSTNVDWLIRLCRDF